MPSETARYTIKKRFPQFGLSIGMNVDLDRLGLERNFAVLEFTPNAPNDAHELLRKLSQVAFLTYRCHEALAPRYVAMFAVPVVHEEKFRAFLNTLISQNILKSYKLERLEWIRYLALRSEYYNYRKGEWSIDWSRVAESQESPPAPPLTIEPAAHPRIDLTDLLIIKELELQAMGRLADMSKKLKINDSTVHWHYQKHVSHLINSYFVHRPSVGAKPLKEIIGLIYEFDALSRGEMEAVRCLFNNFPFTWNEGGRKDGYYRTELTIPVEHLAHSFRYLTAELGKHLTRWTTYTLDMTTSTWYTIPYQNFDKKKGWLFDEERALESIRELWKE
jgi:hypothetical protein